MSPLSRRFAQALLATAMAASLAAEPAFAQLNPSAPTNSAPGGTSSTTAPSNGEGTPAGGTGVIGAQRVGPAVAPTTVAPATPMTTTPRRTRRVRPRRVVRHPAAPAATGTQSGSGLNGSTPGTPQ